MKPDWKDAPEWAQWVAMDADGKWYWHEDEPVASGGEWFSTDGRCRVVRNMDWKESLEPRP
jgi:hypothetical protein